MNERPGIVTFQSNPLTLVGPEITPGDACPDFALQTTDLEKRTAESLKGKVTVLITVPSLDTSVCSMETKKFNEQAANLSEEIEMVVVSMDLPFAQKRWADEYGATGITFLSDHYEASLGEAMGVLIKELRLLARTIFILDRDNVVRYVQVVPEVTDEPDYDAVIEAAKGLV
jgi:thiol peroxidase